MGGFCEGFGFLCCALPDDDRCMFAALLIFILLLSFTFILSRR